MKKILLSIAITISSISFSQIATKQIGIDSTNGLTQQIRVTCLTIEATSNVITVWYDIQTLAPNGVPIWTSPGHNYTRVNKPGDLRFDLLRDSALGQGIKQLILNDLVPINGIGDLQKLQQ